jgi:hypothetical protein
MPLAFPDDHAIYDYDTRSIHTAAFDGDKRIIVVINVDDLQGISGDTSADPEGLVRLFLNHAGLIRATAFRKYSRGDLDSNGMIKVTAIDMRL